MSEKEQAKLRHKLDRAMRMFRRSQESRSVESVADSVPSSNRKPIDRWLSFGIAIVGLIFWLVTKTPTTIIVCLGIIFVLACHPIWNFWWVEKNMWRRVVVLIVLLGSLGAFGRYVWPPPQLHISIGFNMVSDSRETSGGLWIAREDYIAPINNAVLLRLVNASDAYVSLHSFSLSLGNAKANKWTELISVHVPGKLYCCASDNKKGLLSQMHEIQLDGGGLFSILQNGGIPPRAHITNWLLFEFPKGFVPDALESDKLAFWDEAGRKYEIIAGPPAADSSKAVLNTKNPVKDELDKLTIKAVYNPMVNLTPYRISHIADERP